MEGGEYQSPDPDDRSATLRADGPANADPAGSDLTSEPSAGQRIPGELWQAAIAVAPFGCATTNRLLRHIILRHLR